MSCQQSIQVQRYHDAELEASEASAVARHLRACPQCAGLLKELESLSGRLSRAAMPELSAWSALRMRQALAGARDRQVRRLAWWMSGAAAAVLAAGLLHRPGAPSGSAAEVERPVAWEVAAVLPPIDAQDPEPATVQLAHWFADDLCGGESWRTP